MTARAATATAHGSCGELVQGMLSDGTAFQVTLPVRLFSTVTVTASPATTSTVDVTPRDRSKAAAAAAATASLVSDQAAHLAVVLANEIPVGAGLGSSTADVVAAIRATAAAFGRVLTAAEVGSIAGSIEVSDGTMHDGICVTDRRGTLLEAWPWWPAFHVVALVPAAPGVDTETVDLHGHLEHAPTYERLLSDLRSAAERRDPHPFLAAAATSATLHQAILGNPLVELVDELMATTGAAGWNIAHTGTALGLLFDGEASAAAGAAELRRRPPLPDLRVLVAAGA